MESTLTMTPGRLKDGISRYFKTPLDDFYCLPANRLMIGTVLFILTGVGVAAALGLYNHINALIHLEPTFIGTHAWHSAANMTLAFILADVGFALLLGRWGAVDNRTVGKTWIIFFTAFLLNQLLYRTLTYRLVMLYEPELFYIWKYVPSMRAGAMASSLFALPFWLVITAIVIKIITTKQSQTETLIDRRITNLLGQQARRQPASVALPDPAKAADEAHLELPLDPGTGPIRASDIGHVTTEDHYLRIWFHDHDRLRNTLIRMPLKELVPRLPGTSFARIHRSHLVNLARVAELKRTGRTVKLAMKDGEFELPVSRSRLPKVLPLVRKFVTP